MRVIGGLAKGRKLLAVPGDTTRPILDRVKTPLFDILRPSLAGSRVLDLFAGSGSVGIEALSQGAEHCTFVDLNSRAIETIRRNLESTGFIENSEIRKTDAFLFLKKCGREFDLIYIAPPQYQTLWLQALQHIAERPELVSAKGKLVIQIDPKEYEPFESSDFCEADQRRYGNTMLAFFSRR
ncbi:MAG: 16S rRNA (guanine(966)-N(2))-methyltransferase RsmD [Proteobacteria bacterium]|nr:MAG: 16S rRNA (guanine(966)-N(2))-methyltransferase RsmD [Pseudomonadota bacterium]